MSFKIKALYLCLIFIAYPFCLFAEDATKRASYAHGLYARKLYKPAIVEYERIVDTEQEIADDVVFRLAESRFQIGKYDLAAETFSRVLDFGHDGRFYRRAQFRKANSLFCAQRFDEAEPLLELIINDETLAPSLRSSGMYFLGRTKQALGKMDKAEALLQKVVEEEQTPKMTMYATFALAQIFAARGDTASACAMWEANAKQNPNNLLSAEGLLRAAELLASTAKHTSDTERSLILYERVVNEFKNNELSIQALRGRAWAFFELGRFEEAIKNCVGILKYGKKDYAPEAEYLKALCVARLGRHKDAVALLEALKAKYPTHPLAQSAQYCLGWVLLESNSKDAINATDEYLKINPDGTQRAAALFIKSQAQIANEDYQDALVSLRAASDAGFRDDVALSYNIALTTFYLGRVDEAAKAFDVFLDKYSDTPQGEDALLQCAASWSEAGDFDKSIQRLKLYKERYPQGKHIIRSAISLAQIYQTRKEWDNMIIAYSDLNRNGIDKTTRSSAIYWISWAYERKNEIEKAKDGYRLIAENYTSTDAFAYAVQRLVQIWRENGTSKDATILLNSLYKNGHTSALLSEEQLWVAKTCLSGGKAETTLAICRNLIEGKNRTSVREDAWLLWGEALLVEGLFAEAYEVYKDMLREFPQTNRRYDADLGLAKALYSMEKQEEAKTIATQIKDSSKGRVRVETLCWLGEVYLKEGETRLALDAFMRVAAVYDDAILVPRALLGVIKAKIAMNEIQQSQAHLAELCDRFPKSKEAIIAKELVNKHSAGGLK